MRPGQLIRSPILLAVGFFLTLRMSMMAQEQSQTTTTTGAMTKQVTVERGEVVYVSGHDLILRMEDGKSGTSPMFPKVPGPLLTAKRLAFMTSKWA
jgi:hypothetical protein